MLKLLRKHWEVSVLFALSILTIWPLLQSGYFSHHDDLQVIRIFEMRKCLADLQIPCRWAPDMGYGYGIPLFNYYNPFVYYVGAILSFVLGFVWSAKALFIITLILGPVAMYFLGRELWGKTGGLVSGVLFMFAPYRALDAYVRGALSELVAISLVPLLFLFILRLIKRGKRVDFFAVTLLTGVFLTTHNISVILWAPFILLWILYWLYQEKFSNLKLLVLSLLLGLGLSAFFTIPAFLEKDLVTSESLTQGDLDYRIHFAGVRQLFTDRFWGYGASKPGPNDDLSMQIGWPHWWMVLVAGKILLTSLVKRVIRPRESDSLLAKIDELDFKTIITPIMLAVFFLIATFMIHNKSAPIWETIGILRYLQFPWRYLAVAVFASSLLGGYIASPFVKKLRIPGTKVGILTVLILVLPIFFNWSYFKPEFFYPEVNDQMKLSGELWRKQQEGAVLDYLPKTAVNPKVFASDPEVVEGDTDIKNFVKRSNSWELDVNVKENSRLELPILFFSDWEAQGYGLEVNKYGRVELTLSDGEHKVKGVFKNTRVRNMANALSALSFLLLVLTIYVGKSRKIFK